MFTEISGSVENLSIAVKQAAANGAEEISIRGEFNSNEPRVSVLSLNNLANVTISGYETILNGNNTTLHVIEIGPDVQNVTIRGFEITGGNTASRTARRAKAKMHFAHRPSIYEYIDGGGILVHGNSSVSFEDCNIHHNHAVMCGGGVSIQQKEPRNWVELKNCVISNNTANHTGGGVDVLTPGSRVSVYDCRLSDNQSNLHVHSGGPHGQITIFPDSFATVIGCDFSNKNFSHPDLDYRRGRGGLYLEDNSYSGPVLDHSLARPNVLDIVSEFRFRLPLILEMLKAANPRITDTDLRKTIVFQNYFKEDFGSLYPMSL